MNEFRARLNDIERRHPLAYAVTLILACDVVLFAFISITGAFAA